jgi:hypothetical protein
MPASKSEKSVSADAPPAKRQKTAATPAAPKEVDPISKNRTIPILPKDVDASCFQYDETDEDGGVYEYEFSLRVPYKKGWSERDFEKLQRAPYKKDEFFPFGARYDKGHAVLAEGTLWHVPIDLVAPLVARKDWSNLVIHIDGVADELYEMMHACTNLDCVGPSPEDVGLVYRGYNGDTDTGLVLVQEIECNPVFRGQGFGRFMLDCALEQIVDPDLVGPVYMDPFPLQWWAKNVKGEGEQMADGFPDFRELSAAQEDGKAEDAKKLIACWEEAGFKLVPDHEDYEGDAFMVRPARHGVEQKKYCKFLQ